MTCGCPIRAEAPDAMTHKDVANFDNLSVEALRKKIVERYMASAFNNCRNQKLKMMFTEQLLQLHCYQFLKRPYSFEKETQKRPIFFLKRDLKETFGYQKKRPAIKFFFSLVVLSLYEKEH